MLHEQIISLIFAIYLLVIFVVGALIFRSLIREVFINVREEFIIVPLFIILLIIIAWGGITLLINAVF